MSLTSFCYHTLYYLLAGDDQIDERSHNQAKQSGDRVMFTEQI